MGSLASPIYLPDSGSDASFSFVQQSGKILCPSPLNSPSLAGLTLSSPQPTASMAPLVCFENITIPIAAKSPSPSPPPPPPRRGFTTIGTAEDRVQRALDYEQSIVRRIAIREIETDKKMKQVDEQIRQKQLLLERMLNTAEIANRKSDEMHREMESGRKKLDKLRKRIKECEQFLDPDSKAADSDDDSMKSIKKLKKRSRSRSRDKNREKEHLKKRTSDHSSSSSDSSSDSDSSESSDDERAGTKFVLGHSIPRTTCPSSRGIGAKGVPKLAPQVTFTAPPVRLPENIADVRPHIGRDQMKAFRSKERRLPEDLAMNSRDKEKRARQAVMHQFDMDLPNPNNSIQYQRIG